MTTFGHIFSEALHAPPEVAKGQHDVHGRPVTWLQNAKIDEVSLVPKGANRKRFTIFKSATGDPSADPFRDLERELLAWLK